MQEPLLQILSEHNYKLGNIVNIQFYTPISAAWVNSTSGVKVPSNCIPKDGTSYIPCGTAFISNPPAQGQCIPIYAGVNTSGQVVLVNDFGAVMYGVQVNFNYLI